MIQIGSSNTQLKHESWRSMPRSAIFSLPIIVLGWMACSKGNASGPSATEDLAQPKTTSAYRLAVQAPPAVKAGDEAVATVQVVPKGPYKMNLEYPLKLHVEGPSHASPRKLELRAKQAKKLTKSELLLQPAFKIGVAGQHRFNGTLRFSVCTEQQCEIKTEKISWTAITR